MVIHKGGELVWPCESEELGGQLDVVLLIGRPGVSLRTMHISSRYLNGPKHSITI